MLRAFSTAATGMTAQQMIVDVIANNLANINTSGFKRSQVDFQDLVYVKMAEAGRDTTSGITAPTGLEIGSGVRAAGTTKVFTQGEMENTANELDVAIEGVGFFEVSVAGGGVRYTRDGGLKINADGNLVTSTGYLLEPNISVKDARAISIGKDGTVSAFIGDASTPSTAGNIALVRFTNPAGLASEGQNLFAETSASGSPETGTPGENGFGTLQQGFLERSNVQMVKELVGLITAQRAYEINSRAIKAGDEMLTTANRLIT